MDGLRVRASHPEVAVEYHLPGPRPTEVLALPGAALDDFEGGKESAVTLEVRAGHRPGPLGRRRRASGP